VNYAQKSSIVTAFLWNPAPATAEGAFAVACYFFETRRTYASVLLTRQAYHEEHIVLPDVLMGPFIRVSQGTENRENSVDFPDTRISIETLSLLFTKGPSMHRPSSQKPARSFCPSVRYLLILGLGCLCTAGCGERITEVTGKATVDGKPLNSKACTIMFAPDRDNKIQRIPSAPLDDNGVFRVQTGADNGVPLGWYKVYVSFDARAAGGKPPPFHARFLKPETSPFSIEVVEKPAPGAYDLPLSEK
jgi:hypothetical protein